jgi:hypothetical protein
MSNETVTVQETESQGSNEGNAPLNNWDAITNAQEFNDGPITENADDVKTDENQGEVDKSQNEAKEGDQAEENQNTEAAKTDENQEKEGDKPADETTEDTPLIEFKAEDVTGTPESEPEDGTWLAVAKAQGVEIKEDSFEAYTQAVEEKYNAKIEEVKALTEDKVLEKYSPEARATIELLNSGLTMEQIYAPVQEIQSLKQLDDVSLIRKALEEQTMPDGTKMWDADMIDAKLEKIAESGRTEIEGKEIRRQLDAMEQQIKLDHSNKLRQFQEKKVQLAEQQKQESAAKFTQAMSTVTEFFGGKISEDAKQAIIKKHQSGAYDNLLSDPKKVAEFVLYNEFGQKAIKNLENTAFQRGREEKTKKLVNVPPVTQNGNGRVITNTTSDNWDALRELGS